MGDGALWQAVQSLPRDQREAVVLFYYEDLPTEEIARVLGDDAGGGTGPAEPGPGEAAEHLEGGRPWMSWTPACGQWQNGSI